MLFGPALNRVSGPVGWSLSVVRKGPAPQERATEEKVGRGSAIVEEPSTSMQGMDGWAE